ncbi:MAG: hypothetical protein FD174_3880 [Geobacteraceae bacterium]|nr:MAG: hypothetical protein FD174_3880 [Geobacteraceae bacterium]
MKLSNLRSRHVALLLLMVSIVFYGLDYLVFGRTAEIAAGFLGNLAFLPIYVLVVTLIIERVLKERERAALMQKMNMVIGVFFSEIGTSLLRDCFGFLRDSQTLADRLKITSQWQDADFERVTDYLKAHDIRVESGAGDLSALKRFLMEKREFMLGLLENPNLLEHDDFTDLLWAVFHLIGELEARKSLADIPAADMEHLSGDIKRVYAHLLREWVAYMGHLKKDYPYLFSLAVRTNPMNPDAKVEVV